MFGKIKTTASSKFPIFLWSYWWSLLVDLSLIQQLLVVKRPQLLIEVRDIWKLDCFIWDSGRREEETKNRKAEEWRKLSCYRSSKESAAKVVVGLLRWWRTSSWITILSQSMKDVVLDFDHYRPSMVFKTDASGAGVSKPCHPLSFANFPTIPKILRGSWMNYWRVSHPTNTKTFGNCQQRHRYHRKKYHHIFCILSIPTKYWIESLDICWSCYKPCKRLAWPIRAIASQLNDATEFSRIWLLCRKPSEKLPSNLLLTTGSGSNEPKV